MNDSVIGPAVAPSEVAEELAQAVLDARASALGAVERMREQLDAVFRERFEVIESRLRQGFQAERDAESLRSESRRELTEALNNAVRRLKQAETRDEWSHTLLDLTQEFCGTAALFAVDGAQLRFEGSHSAVAAATGIEIPISAAPAFAAAVESKDTVVAVGTPRELSQTVSGLLGDASHTKVYLFPVLQRQRPVAVLYAEPDDETAINVSALELLTSLAGGALNEPEPSAPAPAGNLVRIAAAPVLPPATMRSADVSREDQEAHLRAQRFARTRIAEIVLRRMGAVRQGRAERNLYGSLREEIDAGRQAFRRQFIDTCPSMVDYYHRELVRTLAKDDASMLGADYPGPLA